MLMKAYPTLHLFCAENKTTKAFKSVQNFTRHKLKGAYIQFSDSTATEQRYFRLQVVPEWAPWSQLAGRWSHKSHGDAHQWLQEASLKCTCEKDSLRQYRLSEESTDTWITSLREPLSTQRNSSFQLAARFEKDDILTTSSALCWPQKPQLMTWTYVNGPIKTNQTQKGTKGTEIRTCWGCF